MLVRLIIDPERFPAAEEAAVREEFPTVAITDEVPPADGEPTVDARAWEDPSRDPAPLDARVADAAARGAFGLRIAGGEALPLLTRYQRFLGRRNRASAGAVFDRILGAHLTVHDLDRPLCRADHEHAIDTWQWLLRLAPSASVSLQAAALFHDVERLESEALVRVEHRAPNYQDFKDAHARRGAEIALAVLDGLGLGKGELDRVAALVEGHERPGADPEGVLLNEADGLSFFSLNSAGFLAYYGADHTARKVAYTRARLRPTARARLARVRLPPEIAALVGRGGEGA